MERYACDLGMVVTSVTSLFGSSTFVVGEYRKFPCKPLDLDSCVNRATWVLRDGCEKFLQEPFERFALRNNVIKACYRRVPHERAETVNRSLSSKPRDMISSRHVSKF